MRNSEDRLDVDGNMNVRLQSIFASMPDGLIVTDSAGFIEEFNLPAEKLLGYSRDEMIGSNALVLMPTSSSIMASDRWGRLLGLFSRRANGVGHGICCRHKDGSMVHVHLSVAEFDEDGQKYFTGVIHDVSERIAIERKLKDAMERVDQASTTKSEFLANMSHEVRTPLNGVMGMLELLRATHLDSRQEGFVEVAYTSANTLLNVISSILHFSKIDSGNLSLHSTVFDLRQVIEQSAAAELGAAVEKGLEYSCQIAPEVPQLVLGDAIQFGRIVNNLLGNAVKFTDSGSIEISVSLKAIKNKRANIFLEIEDTGIGIASSELPDLFEPFTQVDGSSTRKHGGSGLGLSITKRLVDLLGGEIGVTSYESKGTKFRVSLSFGIISAPETALENNSSINTGYRNSDQTKAKVKADRRILVVDDIATNRRVCKAMLRKLGFEADLAINGSEAVEAIVNQHYDLVLMDCQMPVLDGYAATRQIRSLEEGKSSSRLPVIALTAHALEGDREASLDAGMDDYLTKPVSMAALESMLDRWL